MVGGIALTLGKVALVSAFMAVLCLLLASGTTVRMAMQRRYYSTRQDAGEELGPARPGHLILNYRIMQRMMAESDSPEVLARSASSWPLLPPWWRSCLD